MSSHSVLVTQCSVTVTQCSLTHCHSCGSSVSQCCEQCKIQTIARIDHSVQSVQSVGLGVIPLSAVIALGVSQKHYEESEKGQYYEVSERGQHYEKSVKGQKYL
eukprot:5070402-Amphidinium_carterae.1